MFKRAQIPQIRTVPLIRMLFSFYPVLLPITLLCILLNAIISSIPSIFMQNIIAAVEQSWQTGDWAAVSGHILGLVAILAIFYGLSLLAGVAYTQLMAVITQGSLAKLREKMFNSMQDLPIRYFDTHNHGDVMSYYTNDIDTLRQMISQSIPQLIISSVVVLTVLCIMLYYSLWMTLVILLGVFCMFLVVRKIGGNSARYFIRQQQAIGRTEGYVEELMNGQKVVKVFCHEEETKADFDKINDALFADSEKANRYANMLMPVLNNIGNVLYVFVAIMGGVFLLNNAPNVSISGLAFSISIVVPFLNMTKQFTGNISQVSNQLNSVIMGLAGTQRIFNLLDEEPEVDEGLRDARQREGKGGRLARGVRGAHERLGVEAPAQRRHRHLHAPCRRRAHVRRGLRLHAGKDRSARRFALCEAGQKVAFVGSTGAGKTTIH